MSIFKRRKKEKKQYVYMDPELDIEEEFRKRRGAEKKDKEFAAIESLQYVHTQCQVISEASEYIEELKTESQAVENYISDVRIVSSQDKKKAAAIKNAASRILDLKEQRKKLRNEKSKLTKSQNEVMQRYESEFPKALSNLQNDEKYCSAVKHDMNMLEAEKRSLKEDVDNYVLRRNNIRNIVVISLLGIIAVYILFIATGQLKKDNGQTIFMVVLLGSAAYAALIVFLLKKAAYNFRLNEKKLARAITLLNKTKIKYVNIKNSVDYQCEKFRVKNSYELGRIYGQYLEEQKKNEKFRAMSIEFEQECDDFAELIGTLGLHDPQVWVAQIYAIVDEGNMKELKRSLDERKRNLRDRIDYNYDRIDKSKQAITNVMMKNPDLKSEIMEIIDSYDR